MVKRWVKVAEPELRLRVESWTQGSDISAVQRDGGLGDLAPVVVLNIGNRGIGLYLPFAGPQPGILLDAVFGARFDPTGNPEAVVEGGRLKVWLLRYKGAVDPNNRATWRDLWVLDTGWQLNDV